MKYSMISFMSTSFPYEDHIEELFIVMVLFCIFPACNIFHFLINRNFLIAAYFSKTLYSLFCAENAIKSKSVSQPVFGHDSSSFFIMQPNVLHSHMPLSPSAANWCQTIDGEAHVFRKIITACFGGSTGSP